MDKVRMGEIALLFLKDRLMEEGMRLNSNSRKHIIEKAKEIGVPEAEALEFSKIMIEELIAKVFDSNKASS
jgi:hypothetical protein